MFLTSPASYLQVADLRNDSALDLTDRAGNALTDATLSQWLEEAAGHIDAMIGQSFLPQQRTIRLHGRGTPRLETNVRPILYVKQAKVVLPNAVGFDIPVQSLLVNHETGEIENMTPLVFQGWGVTTLFPRGVPIDVTLAHGLSFAIAPPTFTATAASTTSSRPISVGTHSISISSVTVSGESLVRTAMVNFQSPGAAAITITNAPGAIRYYIYLDNVFAAEVEGFAFGEGVITTTVDATPSSSVIAINADGTPKAPATTDTTPMPLNGRYAALRRATRFLVQQAAWEFKNPANQGLFQQKSGPKMLAFKDTVNSSVTKQLDDMLSALQYQGL